MLKKIKNIQEIKNYLLLKKLSLIDKNKTIILLVKKISKHQRTIIIFIRITHPKISHKNTNNYLTKKRLKIILTIIKHYFLIAIISIQRNQIFKKFNNNYPLEKRKIIAKIIINYLN